MKKLFVLAALLCALPAGAELVSEVSFNPSRLGKYEFLKVSGPTRLDGGLQIEQDGALRLSSAGTIDWVFVSSGTASSAPSYTIAQVTSDGSGESAVLMPNTIFLKANQQPGYIQNYNASAASVEPQYLISKVELGGGNTAFEQSSYVQRLQADSEVHLYADKINIHNTTTPAAFYVNGSDNSSGSPGPTNFTYYDKPTYNNNEIDFSAQSRTAPFVLDNVGISPYPPIGSNDGCAVNQQVVLKWSKRYACTTEPVQDSSGILQCPAANVKKVCVLAYVCTPQNYLYTWDNWARSHAAWEPCD